MPSPKRTTRDAYGRVAKVEEYTGTFTTCSTAVGAHDCKRLEVFRSHHRSESTGGAAFIVSHQVGVAAHVFTG